MENIGRRAQIPRLLCSSLKRPMTLLLILGIILATFVALFALTFAVWSYTMAQLGDEAN
jgi:hypothetical protein